MNIVKYYVPKSELFPDFNIEALLENGAWFSLPPTFECSPLGRIQAEQLIFNLTEWYGLPVDAEIIMSHFTKEILK